MGLPGAGKTTFALKLIDRLGTEQKSFSWYNGDNLRYMYDDWDFSEEGRLRQTQRMAEKANIAKENKIYAICDYVCPKEEYRKIFDADITIWIDTIKFSRYRDTDQMFEKPEHYTLRITDFDFDKYIEEIITHL